MATVDSREPGGLDILKTAKTARDLIRDGAAYLDAARLGFHHGTDNALDEAAALVLHALQIDHDVSGEMLDRELTAPERSRVIDLLERRVTTRSPAAYLLHEAWFAGMPFYVDARVLVPRSPLAELIEVQFTPWIDPSRVHRVLDLCSGSGCIGIACAQYFPEADVTLTDLSPDALAVARINVERHALADRVTLLQSDVFADLAGRCFDIIVSNPPYVPREEMAELPVEFSHEPVLGLVAGDEGLDVVVRILRDASDHLTPAGILIVEVGDTQQALTERFPDVPFLWLEFARGGEGVLLLERDQLLQYRETFGQAASERTTD